MSTIYSINSFLTYRINKRGLVEVTRTKEQELNLYKLLRDFGFEYKTINGKRHFFQTIDNTKAKKTKTDINNFIFNYLKSINITNDDENIYRNAVLNWYISKGKVKFFSGFFEYCLNVDNKFRFTN